MRGKFLVGSNESFYGYDIFSDKSAVVLDWLLIEGNKRRVFGLREVSEESKISVGLVHRIFKKLIFSGILITQGVRTNKKFILKKPEILLKQWHEHYNITEKCKMWTYRSRLQDKNEMLKVVKHSSSNREVTLALHSAAEALKCKNTNLMTLELYFENSLQRAKLEKLLQLEPQERGYEILLIKPFYNSLLKLASGEYEGIRVSSPLLTYLDLYHFPLRGREQAEFMINRIPELNRIYKKGE